MEFTTGEILSTLTAVIAIIGAVVALVKSRPDIINTQQNTISELAKTQDLLVLDVKEVKKKLKEVTTDRDKWRDIAECYLKERDEWRDLFEKAEKRIAELKKIIKNRKWD